MQLKIEKADFKEISLDTANTGDNFLSNALAAKA